MNDTDTFIQAMHPPVGASREALRAEIERLREAILWAIGDLELMLMMTNQPNLTTLLMASVGDLRAVIENDGAE